MVIQLYIFFSGSSPYQLLQNVEYSSLCYTVGGKESHLPMQEMQEMWVQSLGWEDPLE